MLGRVIDDVLGGVPVVWLAMRWLCCARDTSSGFPSLDFPSQQTRQHFVNTRSRALGLEQTNSNQLARLTMNRIHTNDSIISRVCLY